MDSQKEDKKSLPTLINKPKRNIAGKFTQNLAPEAKIRNSKDYQFYGITKTNAGDATLSLALKLILENGEQLILQYHELQSPIRFKPADLITFSTPTLSVTIEGKKLESILDYISEHRLVWIKEPDNSFGQANDNEPQVTNIKIEEKS